MKMNRTIFFLCSVLWTGIVHGSGRFYVGMSVLGTLKHSKISLDSDYWGSVVKEAYRDSIAAEDKAIVEKIKELADPTKINTAGTNDAPFYANAGLPSDLVQDELHKQKVEYYDGNPFAPGFSVTLGAFCLRKKNILAAIEITGGRTFRTETVPGHFRVISAQFPFPVTDEIVEKVKKLSNTTTSYIHEGNTYKKVIKNDTDAGFTISIPAESGGNQVNPRKNTRLPITYIQIPDVETTMALEFKETFSSRLLLRIGTVLNDRVYLCVQLGGEATRLHFKLKQTADKKFETMYYAYLNDFYISASGAALYHFDELPASENVTPENTKLTCDQSVTRLAIVGGIGAEFFLNRRLSARLDVTVAFGPDTLINTDRPVKLRYSELRGQAGLGIVWRF